MTIKKREQVCFYVTTLLPFFVFIVSFLPLSIRPLPDERPPSLRPADIHSHMGNNGCHFLFCYPMAFCIFQMVSKRRVCYAGCHQRYDSNDTLQFDGNCLFIPYLSEQHIIIQMCKHRCKISKAFPSCGLYNFFTHLVFLQSCKIFLLFFK